MDGVQMIVLVVVGITAVVFFVCWIVFTANRQGVDANSQNTSQQQPSINPQVSVGIIIIYAVVTWLIVSALAKAYVELVMAPKFSGYSMSEAQPVMWSWACALMGIFLALRLKRWGELLWGGVFFVACLAPSGIPFIGRELGGLVSIVIGIGYFSWCYVKLEKDRLTVKTRTASISEGPRLDLYKLDDDELYRIIWDELENDSTDKAIWSRLYVKHEGNSEKIRVAYIEDRFINLKKDRDEQSKIVGWIENFSGSSEGRRYSSVDLNRLQDELLQDTGDPELWKECVHWAKRTGKNVEDHYRKVRLQEIKKKGNRVTGFRNS